MKYPTSTSNPRQPQTCLLYIVGGRLLSDNGDTVAVGAPYDDDNGRGSGGVRVYLNGFD